MENHNCDHERLRHYTRLDYLWLISAEILIRTTGTDKEPPRAKNSRKCSTAVRVDDIRVMRESSGLLRILIWTDDDWERMTYSGHYWYGLYTGPPEEQDEKEQQTNGKDL